MNTVTDTTLGWLLIIIAAIVATLLVLHVESEKKLSYKFTIISVIILSFCIGYGIQFWLLAGGF
ncbi:MAG TPA: hypothetical protein VKM55_02015 [Candidatus Lokiarchaeia archaeon]|nr:hypothetical protein [Candidatus Lokiarchaeia archaeon]